MKFAWDPRKEATNVALPNTEYHFLKLNRHSAIHSPLSRSTKFIARVENLSLVGGSSERLESASCLSDIHTVRRESSGSLVPVIGK
jgi:hypothetical protein